MFWEDTIDKLVNKITFEKEVSERRSWTVLRRAMILAAVAILFVLAAVPTATANEGASVYVSKSNDDVWGFNMDHYNPCTGTWETVTWEAEHRNQAVDKDGDWATEADKHKHGGVMELLWVTYSDPDWDITWVGDRFAQNGWDEVVWFGDQDQASVMYKVTLRATNTVTGESFQTRHDLHWVSNGNGDVIHGQGSQTNHATPCHVKGNV